MSVANENQSTTNTESHRRMDESKVETADSTWKSLYRIGGAGALIAGLVAIVDIFVFVVWPQPTSLDGWFTLSQNNWLVGLLDLVPLDWLRVGLR